MTAIPKKRSCSLDRPARASADAGLLTLDATERIRGSLFICLNWWFSFVFVGPLSLAHSRTSSLASTSYREIAAEVLQGCSWRLVVRPNRETTEAKGPQSLEHLQARDPKAPCPAVSMASFADRSLPGQPVLRPCKSRLRAPQKPALNSSDGMMFCSSFHRCITSSSVRSRQPGALISSMDVFTW